MTQSIYNEIRFTDADVVNPEEFIPRGEFNPHSVRPFLLHDHGFVICVVFADHLQDALDIAVDADKLDRFQVDQADLQECEAEGKDPGEVYVALGGAGELFDIEGLSVEELPVPNFSFCALFNNYVGEVSRQEHAIGDGGYIGYNVATGRVYAVGETYVVCSDRVKREIQKRCPDRPIPVSYMRVSPSAMSCFEQLISMRDREEEGQ